MVECVVVETEKLEEVRISLSEKGLVNKNWKIETEDGKGYIPVKSTQNIEYQTTDRTLTENQEKESVSDIIGYKPTYEWLGNIVLLDEDEPIDEIVNGFKQSSHDPKTILNKKSDIKGEKRIRDWEILLGGETKTRHSEYGFDYELDVTEVYFTPRLAEERQRVASTVENSDNVLDMFAGVGPFTIPLADKGANVTAVDINSDAIEYLRRNLKINGVSSNVKSLSCDVRDIKEEYANWADVIIMNLPHTANQFLDTAVNIASDDAHIFYYDFCHDDTDLNDLVDEVGSNITNSDVKIQPISYTEVRPYAPRVKNVCLEFSVSK